MKKLFLIIFTTVISISLFEVAVRLTLEPNQAETGDLHRILDRIPSQRELENRYSVYNYIKALEHPNKDQIKILMLGTSRTKILKPSLIEQENVFIAGGNSYGETSHSFLIDLIVLTDIFPNIEKVFVETSLLTRHKPDEDWIEEHHHFYPYLALKHVKSLNLPSLEKILEKLIAKTKKSQKTQELIIYSRRNKLRLSNFFNEKPSGYNDSKIYKNLDLNGEEKSDYKLYSKTFEENIDSKHIKVQRLTKFKNFNEMDHQFVEVELYAKAKGIELVFFQPPVRSDLFTYQKENGLEVHIKNINSSLSSLFLDFNLEVTEFGSSWELFGDHDHLTTKRGNVLFLTGLFNSTKDSKLINKDSILQFLSKEKPALHRKYFLKDQ